MTAKTAKELVGELENLGITVCLSGENIRLRGPSETLSRPEIAEQVRARKGEIVRFLLEGQEQTAPCGSPACVGCYSVGVLNGKERFIHPPKVSAEWKAWLARWKPAKGERVQ